MSRRKLNTRAALRRASFATWLARRAAIARRRAAACERKAIARIEAHRRDEIRQRSDEVDAAAGIASVCGSWDRRRCPSLDYYDEL